MKFKRQTKLTLLILREAFGSTVNGPLPMKSKMKTWSEASKRGWKVRKRMAEARARPASTIEPAGA